MKNTSQTEQNYLYCYNYLNNYFIKSSFTHKLEINLNDRLFQQVKLYTQIFERELQTIEDNYKSWILDIENYYKYTHNTSYKNFIEFDHDETLKIRINEFNKACIRILYFSFVQWIRHKNHKERYILFPIFKQILLYNDVEYMHLFCRDILQIGDNTIGFNYINDKDIYKYAFSYIDHNKLSKQFNQQYQIIVDYSNNSNFVTSTNPVVPLFDNEVEPYGLLFILSPNLSFRLVLKSRFYDKIIDEPFAIACTCSDKDEKRMNLTQFINSPNSFIISNTKSNAINVFKDISMPLVKKLQNEIDSKKNKLWSKMNDDIKFLNLNDENETEQ